MHTFDDPNKQACEMGPDLIGLNTVNTHDGARMEYLTDRW